MADLEVQGLKRSFPNGTDTLHVLAGVSFTVAAGTMVAIRGESGSGKSTLLSVIAGLDRPDEGTVLIGGEDLTRMTEDALTAFRARHIGLIFQFHYLLRDFNALENVMLPAFMAGETRKKATAKARALIADMGLSEREDHLPAQLSGGERQRIACARALMNDPDFIFADEPTGNLDEANSEQVARLLFDLVAGYRKTLLLVTHSNDLAHRAGRILQLEGGLLRDEV